MSEAHSICNGIIVTLGGVILTLIGLFVPPIAEFSMWLTTTTGGDRSWGHRTERIGFRFAEGKMTREDVERMRFEREA